MTRAELVIRARATVSGFSTHLDPQLTMDQAIEEAVRLIADALEAVQRETHAEPKEPAQPPQAEPKCRTCGDAVLTEIDSCCTDCGRCGPTRWELEQRQKAQPPLPTWAEVRSELTDVLTGGNHLASALIHYLGAGKGFPPYGASHDEARAVIKDPLHYDLWCCWRSIMHMREALLSRIPEGE